MAVNIVETLRELQLSKLKRSISASEVHEQKVSNAAARATEIISGNSPHAGKDNFEEYTLRDVYMRALEAYERKTTFAYSGQPFTPRGLALWKRAVKAWKASGVDQKTFVDAQFTYFHEHFRKAPTAQQLTTDAAVVRGASVAPQTVITNNIAADLNLGELFSRCEKQMNDIMRAQKMTREEVYVRLVKTKIMSFPDKYLNADPVWRNLK